MNTAPSSAIGTSLPFLTGCVYLDYNATTPIFPEVAQEMQPFLTEMFGNPSSTHAYGKRCKLALDLARSRLADAVGALENEIVFTSCGSESNNWAITGAVSSSSTRLPHIVTTNIEHPAVTACLKNLEEQGLATFTEVGVSKDGIVNPSDIAAAITPETCLVTVMHGNNEIGSVQPIREISEICRERGVLIHTDAAQSFGKVPLDVKELGVDMATFVGHKIGAPKGVAALYLREGVEIPNMLLGGGQEAGRRAGTESMVLVAGFGKAADLIAAEGEELQRHMKDMRNRLRSKLESAIPEESLMFNGPEDDSKRIANTLSVSIKGANASLVLLELQDTVAISAGAACKRGEGATVSATLKAIQVPPEYALGTLRLSVGRHTTEEEIDRAAELVVGACSKQGIATRAAA